MSKPEHTKKILWLNLYFVPFSTLNPFGVLQLEDCGHSQPPDELFLVFK